MILRKLFRSGVIGLLAMLPLTGVAGEHSAVIGLSGYSPVSYQTKGIPEKGDSRYRAEHDGVMYLFTSEAQLEAFNGEPDRFVPAYGGWCSLGMTAGKKFPADPLSFKVIDGRTHLFVNNEDLDARSIWNQQPEAAMLQAAEKGWGSLHTD